MPRPRFNPREYQISRPTPQDVPWPLLLDADPSEARVRGYLDAELFRVAWRNGEIVACYVLVAHEPTRYELMNIAVTPALRGSGLGRWMLGHAIGLAESKGARTIEVATGNSSFDALRFYQRNGFRIVAVVPDFFTEHYPEPIVENGIQCRDQLRLRLELTPE
jgi:ribosomal protein S18 acetylase RimI-like enzyme